MLTSPALQNTALLVGRLLLAFIFVTAGWGKITGYAGTAGFMAKMGVPELLLPVAIAVELLGGIAVAIGFQTRLAALVLAGFTLITGLIFHYMPADQGQMIHFSKNLAIAGGFLALFVSGAGAWSLDAKRSA